MRSRPSQPVAHDVALRLERLPAPRPSSAPPTGDGRFAFEDHRGKSLEHVTATGATLHGCDFGASTWSGVDLGSAHVDLCRFDGATLKDVHAVRSSWIAVDLRDAQLVRADLRGAVLLVCDLRGVEFDRVDLRDADLRGCDLRGAIFIDTKTDGVLWEGADLRGTLGGPARGSAPGARTGGSFATWVYGSLSDVGGPAHRWRRAKGIASWIAFGLAVLLPLIFFGRALLYPIDPDAPPAWSSPP